MLNEIKGALRKIFTLSSKVLFEIKSITDSTSSLARLCSMNSILEIFSVASVKVIAAPTSKLNWK